MGELNKTLLTAASPVTNDREAGGPLTICLMAYDQLNGQAGRVEHYARAFSRLCAGQFCRAPLTVDDVLLQKKPCVCDLLVCGESHQPWLQRFLSGSGERKLVEHVSTSLLLVPEPRWPIRHILLLARAEPTDDAAVAWVERLAASAGAAVTILAITPALPALYAQGNNVQPGLEVLLSPNTPSGEQLRRTSHRLTRRQIEGTLRLRQGEPDAQIRQEVAEGNYDLIVIAAEPRARWQRWLLGELVGPLLRWVDRPLLIARSTVVASDR